MITLAALAAFFMLALWRPVRMPAMILGVAQLVTMVSAMQFIDALFSETEFAVWFVLFMMMGYYAICGTVDLIAFRIIKGHPWIRATLVLSMALNATGMGMYYNGLDMIVYNALMVSILAAQILILWISRNGSIPVFHADVLFLLAFLRDLCDDQRRAKREKRQAK